MQEDMGAGEAVGTRPGQRDREPQSISVFSEGPGLGSFSRADRGIGGVRNVAPPTWLVSNFLVRPASS